MNSLNPHNNGGVSRPAAGVLLVVVKCRGGNEMRVIIHTTILGLIIAGGWYGITEAKNISIFAVWMIIAVTFFAAMLPADELFKNNKNKKSYLMRFIFMLEIIALAALGSFFTAFFYSLSWILMWSKRAIHEDKSEAGV